MLQYVPLRQYKRAKNLISMWNKEFKHVAPISKYMYNKYVLDSINLNKDASFVATYDNSPVGFIFVKTWLVDSGYCNEQDHANVSLIFVKKEIRNMGIGSDLLKLAIDEIRKNPNIKVLEVGNEIDKLFPGVPNDIPNSSIFFINKGFIQREGVVDMISIVKNSAEENIDTADLNIRVATEDDQDRILKLCIKNKWNRTAYSLSNYFAEGGSGRRIVIASKEDEIIAIARIYQDNKLPVRINALAKDNDVGSIVFVGIDNKYQDKGYDTIINTACKNYLIKRGCTKIMIPATKKIQYYKKLGYSAFKYYLRFDMEI